MPRVALLLVLLLLSAFAFTQEAPVWTVGTAEQLAQQAMQPTGTNERAAVVFLPKPPVIDGVLAEYGNTLRNVSYLLPALKGKREAVLRFACDWTALYLAGHVTDDTPLQNAHTPNDGFAALNGDALRLGIQAGNTVVAGIYYSTPAQEGFIFTHGLRGEGFRTLTPDAGAKAVFVKDKDGKGYVFEIKLPWKALGCTPKAAGAHIAWEVRWGDRTGALAALVDADGLTEYATAGQNALADPSRWGALEWLTAQQAQARMKPPVNPLPEFAYTLPANAYVTLVVEDAQGRRVRNLISEAPRKQGARREVWDGRDDDGKLLPVGAYRWRGLWHTGLTPEYLMSFNNPGTPPYTTDNASSWGADHDCPKSVAAGGERMFLAYNNCEAGHSLFATNQDGRKLWGWRSDPEVPWDTVGLAANDKYVYLAKSGWAWGKGKEHGAALVRFDAATGKYADWPRETTTWGAGRLLVRGFTPEQPDKGYVLNGLSLGGNVLYLSFFRENLVEMRDAQSGQVLGTLPVNAPGASAVDAAGNLLVVSGKQLVRINPANKEQAVLHEFEHPAGVIAGVNGEIYIADQAPDRVIVLDRDGEELRRIGREGGRQTVGAWQADGMLNPCGLAFDQQGRLWVAEADWWPKRFSIWAMDGQFAKEFVGPTPYGCMTSFLDPDDHRTGYSSGAKFRLDYATKSYTPTAMLGRADRPGALFWDMMVSGQFRTVKGARYFINEGGAYGLDAVFAVKPDRMQALAAVGYVGQLKDRPLAKDLIPAGAKDTDWFSWSDKNGDALATTDELQFIPSPTGQGFGTYWGGFPGYDLTMYWPSGGQLWAFPVTGWTAAGAPIYDLTKARKFADLKGEVGYLGADDEGRVIIRGQPVMAFRSDGTVDWTYPSQYAMHGHPGPPEPGRIVEVHRIPGLANLPKTAGGQFFVMNGNNGEWYFMTTDGLFIQHIFRDIRVGGHRGPEYVIFQEAFGGNFVRDSADGNYYILAGHTDARVFRLDGLDSLRRFPAQPLNYTATQYAAAQQALADQVYRDKEIKSAVVPRLKDGPGADGFATQWPDDAALEWTALNGSKVTVRKAWDQTALYLRYEVADPTPLKNGATDAKMLFKYGDAVDLQLAVNPAADPRRAGPVAGDLRLLISEIGGKPVAVLYEPVVPGVTGGVPFSSPWRAITIARVRQVTEAVKLRVTRQDRAYTIEAMIPWATLGITPEAGVKLRGDFGVLFGNESGENTLLRSYWSNENTAIVSDVPSEASLEPRQWGELAFE